MDNIASGVNATVVGGDNNDAIGNQSSVFGGRDNTAAGIASTASGGIMNAAVGQQATAIGGSITYWEQTLLLLAAWDETMRMVKLSTTVWYEVVIL